jgi:hypothetical protein
LAPQAPRERQTVQAGMAARPHLDRTYKPRVVQLEIRVRLLETSLQLRQKVVV